MKIFWTEAALEEEVRRRVFLRRQAGGALFDPERIPAEAVRVAIAAYHRVGLPAIKEDSYFIRPMREALQAFGRHLMCDSSSIGTTPRQTIDGNLLENCTYRNYCTRSFPMNLPGTSE